MYIRPGYRKKSGKRHAYWYLVESYRTASGPRQRTVAYLGDLDEAGRLGIKALAEGTQEGETGLFPSLLPRYVEVDHGLVRVENIRDFGGYWLGLELMRRLGLDGFLRQVLPVGRETIGWDAMVKLLVLCRLIDPSSELYIAEHLYERSGLQYLLGVPASAVDDNRLYRALDHVLPYKEALETHLKTGLGTLFDLHYDLVLYDITSTYFEGQAEGNPQAQRGYSRDHRPDCKQVCIGLVVTREGLPLGYEIFAGNRGDVTTLQEIVTTMEDRYGRADRIWCLDRGMVSNENMDFLKQEGRRYIVGTPRSMLKAYQQHLPGQDWQTIHDGLEVKLCAGPEGTETFILCRSTARREKERAIHQRFEQRIEEGLKKIAAGTAKRAWPAGVVERRIGRLLGQNSRAAGLFDVTVKEQDGRASVTWTINEAWRQWADLSEGCYLLRSNVADWTAAELWQAYMHLTDAEAAFRIHKSDLRIRPVWHQKQDRVQAHILVCFLAFVLWKMLALTCKRAGLGDEPRRVLAELAQIKVMDVILPVKSGQEIRLRVVGEPTEHQKILLHKLDLVLPKRLDECKM
jgi:transposase